MKDESTHDMLTRMMAHNMDREIKTDDPNGSDLIHREAELCRNERKNSVKKEIPHQKKP